MHFSYSGNDRQNPKLRQDSVSKYPINTFGIIGKDLGVPRVGMEVLTVPQEVKEIWIDFGKAGWARFGRSTDMHFLLDEVSPAIAPPHEGDRHLIFSGTCILSPLLKARETLRHFEKVGLALP